MTTSALVLFSGGQDSTTCLAWALARFDRVETVGFDYGQRHRSELAARPDMKALRQRVLDLCKRNNLRFLNAARASDNSVDSVIQQIKDGGMILESDAAAAIKGREYTKRKMPV